MKAYGYSHRDLGNVCPCCYDKSKPEWKKAARKRARRLARQEIDRELDADLLRSLIIFPLRSPDDPQIKRLKWGGKPTKR